MQISAIPVRLDHESRIVRLQNHVRRNQSSVMQNVLERPAFELYARVKLNLRLLRQGRRGFQQWKLEMAFRMPRKIQNQLGLLLIHADRKLFVSASPRENLAQIRQVDAQRKLV